MNSKKPIYFFNSLTFWGVLFTLIISVGADVTSLLEKEKIEPKDAWLIFVKLCGAGLTMVLRVAEGNTPLYTDNFLPGPNIDDFSITKTRSKVNTTSVIQQETNTNSTSLPVEEDITVIE